MVGTPSLNGSGSGTKRGATANNAVIAGGCQLMRDAQPGGGARGAVEMNQDGLYGIHAADAGTEEGPPHLQPCVCSVACMPGDNRNALASRQHGPRKRPCPRTQTTAATTLAARWLIRF